MSQVEIKATAKLEDQEERIEATFSFTIGETLAEDIEMFGEEVVRDMWLRAAVVKGQAAVRRELENGTHPDDVQEALSDWRPDIQHTTKKDPKLTIKQKFASLSDEEKAEVLAALGAS